MRVLLVPPKYNYPDPAPHVDFGLGQSMPYLAGALKGAGHEVFGANLYHIWCHGSAPLTLERVLRETIEKYQPQLIGIGGLANSYFFIRDAIFFCRQIAPEIPIVCGGGIVTHDSQYIFPHLQPDYAIVGEGEVAIVKLVECLEKGGELEFVPNLAYWKNGQAIFNKEEYPENLDELPFPDYDPFDYETYLSLYNQANNSLTYSRLRPRLLPITIGRSCPFRCTFCCKASKYRSRSIDNALKEIAYFYGKYQFNIIFITDELFSVKNGKALEFCTKIKALKKELKADFDWSCHLRVKDVNRDLLREMKEAGCVFIGYGFESASNTVLKSMKKGEKSEDILRAIQLTEEAGIGIQANFIFGDIAETSETIEETIDFYNEFCKDHCVEFHYITPYPGSALFQHCLDKALITDKAEYYKTVAHYGASINMTSMSDDVFYKLTGSIMSDTHNYKAALIESCEKSKLESCDWNIPFELRRTFYEIKATCPHCFSKVDYLYPIRIDSEKPVKLCIPHYCTKCHKKILLDVTKQVQAIRSEEDPYLMFYQQTPYLAHYPFDSKKYVMRATPTPQLLESYKGYNIVRYTYYIYGIAQALGPLDIPELTEDHIEKYQKRGLWVTGSSVAEVVKFIDGRIINHQE